MEDSTNEVRKRARYVANDWEESVPFGGKVYLARKKKPDSWWIFAAEIALIFMAVSLGYFGYYHFETMYTHTVRIYAHLGYKEAQHQLGQRYLRGRGVAKHRPRAMHWFQQAADQGHEHAAYNLAVGKLRGLHILERGRTRKHLELAASKGISEARRLLDEACGMGKCDD